MLPRTVHISLIGDYQPLAVAHQAIPLALKLAGADLQVNVEFHWRHTSALGPSLPEVMNASQGVWCVPASPYADTAAVLGAIRLARESKKPFLGTCGGFQHALLEYAHNVLQEPGSTHAELDPEASNPLIAPLSCALVETSGRVSFQADSRIAHIYGYSESVEGYHCSFGLSPAFEFLFAHGPLRIVGRDEQGEARAVELSDHPFFVATLFQPERAALRGETPPLVRAFVSAAVSCAQGSA